MPPEKRKIAINELALGMSSAFFTAINDADHTLCIAALDVENVAKLRKHLVECYEDEWDHTSDHPCEIAKFILHKKTEELEQARSDHLITLKKDYLVVSPKEIQWAKRCGNYTEVRLFSDNDPNHFHQIWDEDREVWDAIKKHTTGT